MYVVELVVDRNPRFVDLSRFMFAEISKESYLREPGDHVYSKRKCLTIWTRDSETLKIRRPMEIRRALDVLRKFARDSRFDTPIIEKDLCNA